MVGRRMQIRAAFKGQQWWANKGKKVKQLVSQPPACPTARRLLWMLVQQNGKGNLPFPLSVDKITDKGIISHRTQTLRLTLICVCLNIHVWAFA